VVDISARLVDQYIDFTVRDFGSGLLPEHRERVFDRYFRVQNPCDQVSGTGLGLSIAREFIESMGGSVGIREEVSPGAAFWFRLPVN
jgi:signal transduction histidine kinase